MPFDRRRAIGAIAGAAALLAAGLLPQRAEAQSFQRFIPMLVELQGWKGNKPDGMSMEMPGNSMITANREYERGNARLTAQVIVGPAAQGALAAAQSGMKIETSEARMSTSNIDGMPVTRTFTFADKSGAVMVALAPNAVFTVAFNGVPEDEALTLARRFNWKAIQAAIPK